MSEEFLNKLKSSSKVSDSTEWDATYEGLPVVLALSTSELDAAVSRLDSVGGLWLYSNLEKELICI